MSQTNFSIINSIDIFIQTTVFRAKVLKTLTECRTSNIRRSFPDFHQTKYRSQNTQNPHFSQLSLLL